MPKPGDLDGFLVWAGFVVGLIFIAVVVQDWVWSVLQVIFSWVR